MAAASAARNSLRIGGRWGASAGVTSELETAGGSSSSLLGGARGLTSIAHRRSLQNSPSSFSHRPAHRLAYQRSALVINSPSPCALGSAAKRSFFSLPDISRIAKIASSAAANASSSRFADSAGEGEVETDGDRQIYHARKILPYSQKQLYKLVSDVPAYSSFIPFCTSSVVLQPQTAYSSTTAGTKSGRDGRPVESGWKPPDDRPFDVSAELRVGFGGFEESYTSRVRGVPYERIEANATEAPLFRSLSTTWSFSPASSSSPHPSTAVPPSDTESITSDVSGDTDTSRGPTLLNIDLTFEFTNSLHRIASQAVLPQVAGRMVEAFEKRCLEVYGPGKV